MKLIIKSIHLEFFKGVQDKVYNFSNPITKILAMNGKGKTTIATAFMWVFFDKDYQLVSNPNIRPIGVEECTPIVTVVVDIDGVEVSIAKIQDCKKGKPDENGIRKVSLNNTYEVNSVPLGEAAFKNKLSEYGVVFDNLLVCMHPSVFTSRKADDMRKILFKMTTAKSDYDIANMNGDTAEVAKLLQSYSEEEISAMNNQAKKKASEQVKSIPDQIIGLEKAKVDFDFSDLELQKKALEEKISACNANIKNGCVDTSELESKKFQLQFKIGDCISSANREIGINRKSIDDKKYDTTIEINRLNKELSITTRGIEEKKNQVTKLKTENADIGEQYKVESAKTFDETLYVFDESKWQFDESSTVCSMCGQTLPNDKIDGLKSQFESRKATAKEDLRKKCENEKSLFDSRKRTEMNRLVDIGNANKKRIDELTKEIETSESNITDLNLHITENQQILSICEEELNKIPESADMSENAEYQELLKKDADYQKQIDDAKSKSTDTTAFEQEKNGYITELESVKSKLAQAQNNIRIDGQITGLQKQQRDYEQTKADAERILEQLNKISKRKNELLVEEINSKFSIVKWKLFDYQKNGEYKEVCVPIIDGFRFGESTNTGREIIAKLDICNSLQKFFGTSYPVFLDNAESLNDFNLPEMNCQLITLSVSEDAEMKVEV